MLYRFMHRQYIDLFRDEGRLRINPLDVYRSSPDMRRDTTEGITPTRISGVGTVTRDQAKAILGLDYTITIGHGGALVHNLHLPKGFLISASARYDKRLLARFACDGCFAITAPDTFAHHIATAIASTVPIHHVIDGAVLYTDHRERHVDVQNVVRLGADIRRAGLADYFVKSRIPYEIEAEYRFVFLTDSHNALAPIDVQLTPDAIRACCEFDIPTPAA